MNDQNSNEELKATWKSTVEFLKLYVENFRLLSTEKMTILMSKGALAGVVAMLALIAFFFISMGLVYLLGEVLPIMWAFIIMGGVYILLAILALLFRRQLFVDPIARFLSKLFLDAPESETHKKL